METNEHRPIDDVMLSAWLDQELDPAERARVDDWLREHPADAERVRRWGADRDALGARLGSVLAEPVPERLGQLVWRGTPPPAAPSHTRSRGWRRATMVAFFVVGGVVGAAAMWVAQRPSALMSEASDAWVHRAALAHAVYVPEIRHPVEVNVADSPEADRAAQEQHLQRWLTKRIDTPVPLFDLRGHGFELVGGRLLPDALGTPCAMLMYQHQGGQRVTVYLRKADSSVPAAFQYEQEGDVGLFYWVEGRTGYALAGSLPRVQLLALAEAIYAQQQRK